MHAAREESWYVETNWGWAVLRYAEAGALLKDRRFRQGNARWPAQNGIHSGMFSDWWQETLLSLEGDDHSRIRRLLMPAFRNKAIAAMQPRFQALANELIDGFATEGRVEFVSQFAEPYASRIICVLLGLPEDAWPEVAHWADDLGKSFGIGVADDLPAIEAALDGLRGYLDGVVADRAVHPQDDLVTTLVQAVDEEGGGRLSRHELGVSLVFLAFAGMETTRNQLGLAVQTLLAAPGPVAAPGRASRARRSGRRGGDAGQPDGHLGDPRGGRGRRLPGAPHPAGRHRADAVPRGGHRPVGDAGPVVRHHRAAAAAPRLRRRCPPLPRVTSSPAPTWRLPCPCWRRRMPDAVADGPGRWLPVSGNTGPVAYPLRFTPGH